MSTIKQTSWPGIVRKSVAAALAGSIIVSEANHSFTKKQNAGCLTLAGLPLEHFSQEHVETEGAAIEVTAQDNQAHYSGVASIRHEFPKN